MLIIRRNQMETLALAQLKYFEDDMVAHIRKYFPNHFRVARETAIREVIRHGVRKAGRHGFKSERNVCLYITVMLMLGSNFDSDALYPWAALVLKNEDNLSPSARADRLADDALKFLGQIAGPNNRHMNRAFLTIQKNYDKIISAPPAAEIESYVRHQLRQLYPRKFETVGEPVIRDMIGSGIAHAKGYGIIEQRGTVLYIILMFMLGSSFDKDPFLPWLMTILRDTAIDQDTKVDRLYTGVLSFLNNWLS